MNWQTVGHNITFYVEYLNKTIALIHIATYTCNTQKRSYNKPLPTRGTLAKATIRLRLQQGRRREGLRWCRRTSKYVGFSGNRKGRHCSVVINTSFFCTLLKHMSKAWELVFLIRLLGRFRKTHRESSRRGMMRWWTTSHYTVHGSNRKLHSMLVMIVRSQQQGCRDWVMRNVCRNRMRTRATQKSTCLVWFNLLHPDASLKRSE